MQPSGLTHPGTSKHSRRAQDPARAFHEGRFVTPRVAQEAIAVRFYDRFLELPVAVVLALMWVAGAALLGSCALALYLSGSLVVQFLN